MDKSSSITDSAELKEYCDKFCGRTLGAETLHWRLIAEIVYLPRRGVSAKTAGSGMNPEIDGWFRGDLSGAAICRLSQEAAATGNGAITDWAAFAATGFPKSSRGGSATGA
jgi:hypothetical protein